MSPERKAELRNLARFCSDDGPARAADVKEALDALDAAERRLSEFDALAKQYNIEGDESAAETFERTPAGYGKALTAAREKLDAAERRAIEVVQPGTERARDVAHEGVLTLASILCPGERAVSGQRLIDAAQAAMAAVGRVAESERRAAEAEGALLTLTIACEQRNLTPRDAGSCERHGRACAEGQALDEAWDLLGEEAKAEWREDWAVERARIASLVAARQPVPPSCARCVMFFDGVEYHHQCSEQPEVASGSGGNGGGKGGGET